MTDARITVDVARLRRVLGRYLSARLVTRALGDLSEQRAHRDPVVVASEAAADAPEPTDLDVARGKRMLRELRRKGMR